MSGDSVQRSLAMGLDNRLELFLPQLWEAPLPPAGLPQLLLPLSEMHRGEMKVLVINGNGKLFPQVTRQDWLSSS